MSKLRSDAKEFIPTHAPGTKLMSSSGQQVAITGYDAHIPQSTAEKMGYTNIGKVSDSEMNDIMRTAKKYRGTGRKRKHRRTAKKTRNVRRRKH